MQDKNNCTNCFSFLCYQWLYLFLLIDNFINEQKNEELCASFTRYINSIFLVCLCFVWFLNAPYMFLASIIIYPRPPRWFCYAFIYTIIDTVGTILFLFAFEYQSFKKYWFRLLSLFLYLVFICVFWKQKNNVSQASSVNSFLFWT